MARSDLEILAEIKLSNRRQFDKQLRSLEQRKVFIDTKRSEQALGRITGKANEFTKSLEASNARVIAFGASVAVIEGVRRAFVDLASTIVTVEDKLTAINSIFGRSTQTIGKFKDELFQIAKSTGKSFEEVADAAQEFARQGLSVEETLKRTNDALILTRLTTLNTEKAISGLTAVVNGFASSALTTTEAINKLRAVETQFAVGSTDLIEAVARSASVAQDANVSFDQLLGLITAIKQRTGLGGATIGQGLKTGLTRLNLPTRIAQLKELGVAVDQSASTFDNLVIASKAIDQAQKDGKNSLATQIGTVVAGQFQISKLSALFRDLASNQSIAGGATEAANKATNEAIIANEQYNKTISAISNSISQNIGSIFSKLGEVGLDEFFKGILKDVNSFLEALQGNDVSAGSFVGKIVKDLVLLGNELKLLKPIAEGFINVLTGPAFITGLIAIANTLKNVFAQGGSSILQLAGFNKLSEKRLANQRTIQSLLSQATASELKQLELANSQVQKEQIILGLLNKQLAVQKALEASSIVTAQSLARKGVSLSGSALSGDVSGRKRFGRSFAGGTLSGAIQNEQRAINNGVGGASGGAEVRVVGAFNYGKGKVGPAVLNSDEILIPNKNGDIVLNRDMVGSSAISSMGGNFARGRIPMTGGKTYKASMDGFRRLLMGNTKFQSVKYYSKSSDSLKTLTKVQHSSMVAHASKMGMSPPAGYNSWKQYQQANNMVTLRGMQGGEQVIKNIKLSDIKQVNAGGAKYIPNFADGRVNLGRTEIEQMEERVRRGEPLTPYQVSRIEGGLRSGQGFNIPPLLQRVALEQAEEAAKLESMDAQRAARGSGRATPKAPPNVSGEQFELETPRSQTSRVIDPKTGQYAKKFGNVAYENPGRTGFTLLKEGGFQPPVVYEPPVMDKAMNRARNRAMRKPPKPENFGQALQEREYREFKRKFNAGNIPPGSEGDAKQFKKFKRRLQLELVEKELAREARAQGRPLTFEELSKSKEGRQLSLKIRQAGLANFKQIEATTQAAIQKSLLTDAQTQLQTGKTTLGFGLGKLEKQILSSDSGKRLDARGRASLKEAVAQRRLQRGQKVAGAGFGLAFAGSLAAPLIGQGVAGVTGSEKKGGIASGLVGGAATGASLGAFAGPKGLAIGAAAGAIIGGVGAALSSTDKEASKYAEALEDQRENLAKTTAVLQNYVDSQQKLNAAVESGTATGSQLGRLSQGTRFALAEVQQSDIDQDLKNRFIAGTPSERIEILSQVQQEGANATRSAAFLAGIEGTVGEASGRKSKIEAETESVTSYSPTGYLGGLVPTTTSIVTNRDQMDASKFTEEEVDDIITSIASFADPKQIDLTAIKEAGTVIGAITAAGVPDSIAEGLSDIFAGEGGSGFKQRLIEEFKKGKFSDAAGEQLALAAAESINLRVLKTSGRLGAQQRFLLDAQAGEAAGNRIATRASTARDAAKQSSRLEFLSSLGLDRTEEKRKAEFDAIGTNFEQKLEDAAIATGGQVQQLFDANRLAGLDPADADKILPILSKITQQGASSADITTLQGLVDDTKLQDSLRALNIELATSRSDIAKNTNEIIKNTIANNNLVDSQKATTRSNNDLINKLGTGQSIPDLFGRTQAETSTTERIRTQMRDAFLDLDSRRFVGGKDVVKETLEDKESPEAKALAASAEVILDQIQILTRSTSEGGLLSTDQSRLARSIISRSFERTGRASATPEDRADIIDRAQTAIDAVKKQIPAFDLKEILGDSALTFQEGLSGIFDVLAESSPVLKEVLTKPNEVVRPEPKAEDLPKTEEIGNEISKITNAIANQAANLQAQQDLANQQAEELQNFSQQMREGIISNEQFVEKATELSDNLAKAVELLNEDFEKTVNINITSGDRVEEMEVQVNELLERIGVAIEGVV